MTGYRGPYGRGQEPARRGKACGWALALLVTAACQPLPPARTGPYFGQTPPGPTPAVFAPGVVSIEGRFEQFLLFSPDETELIYGVTNSDWSDFSMHLLRREDGDWADAGTPPFLDGDPSALTIALTAEGRTVFFSQARPTYPPDDVWTSHREEAAWSRPTKLPAPVSSDADEFEVAVAANGTLYFSSNREGGSGDMDIYRAPLVDGAYPTAENLGPPINTASGDDLPFVAPDESYLIFASNRPGGLGLRDLYISFQVDGAWTEPRNLGRPINSEQWDIYPSVSPDGRYLFFTRRLRWQAADDEDSDIYWVDAGFIDRLRPARRSTAGH